jgi:3-oxoadipate enol-lactonase
MTERRIDVPGGHLAVHDFGEGSVVLLLHANIVTAWAWEPLTPFLLQAGYRVIAFDARGMGDSVTDDVAYSARADAIAVLDALAIDQAVLVGNSVGGQVAVDTAIEFPDRVAGLVTIGANISGWSPPMPAHEQAIEDELVRVKDAGDPDAIADADVRAWVDGPGQPPDRVLEDIRELVREMDHGITASDDPRGRPIRMEPPAAEQLKHLTAPLLAIAGELDFSFAADTARYLEAHAPDARELVMPGVAHMIGLEAPDDLAAHITTFLAALPAWR